MATPISKTIGELFGYSGFKSCKAIYDFADSAYPAWTEDTSVDVLAWTEGLRAINQSGNANYAIYRGLTNAQKQTFINWALTAMINHTPDSYPRKAAMITLKNEIADYMAAPTAPKRTNLLAKAKAIKPTTSSEAELLVANGLKGITVAVATNQVTGEVLQELGRSLNRAGARLAGLTVLEVNNAILTKLQQIIGIID